MVRIPISFFVCDFTIFHHLIYVIYTSTSTINEEKMKGCEKGQEKGHKQRRWWAALTPLDLPKE
jgi:hypothetical protein